MRTDKESRKSDKNDMFHKQQYNAETISSTIDSFLLLSNGIGISDTKQQSAARPRHKKTVSMKYWIVECAHTPTHLIVGICVVCTRR